MQHSELYKLFTGFWWLLFPLGWGLGGLIRLWLRHVRARQTLDILKSYVDQGKEPPPEILNILQHDTNASQARRGDGLQRSGILWIPVFLFGALSCGFILVALSRTDDHDNHIGLLFVAIVMAGLSLGFLVTNLLQKKAGDQDRLPPK